MQERGGSRKGRVQNVWTPTRAKRNDRKKGRKGGDGVLWSPSVTALQEWESKARTELLNELMMRTFDVHYSEKKKNPKKHPHSFHIYTHSLEAEGRIPVEFFPHGITKRDDEKCGEIQKGFHNWNSTWMTGIRFLSILYQILLQVQNTGF